MQSPVQITFRDMPPSPSIAAQVEKRAAKLDTFFDRIIRCHVVVEAPHRHKKHGRCFHVRIDIHVPGRELVVSKNPDDAELDAHAAVDAAFGDAERILEELAAVRVDTKVHLRPPHGVVAKLFFDRGYGFIEAEDGREVYFHANSVLGSRFDKLSVGSRVRFAEEDGDHGPQASTVHAAAET
jgi:cold shock CspA family protein/ribosome-associated translation inhibitor RaiA